MARKVTEQLEEEGIELKSNTVIKSVEKIEERVFNIVLETRLLDNVTIEKIQVNTILMAIGRDPNPSSYGADSIGIELDKGTKKILGRKEEPERTNFDHIYAVGDIVQGVPELMPVAQKSGKLLAKRIHLRLNNKDLKIEEKDILKQWSTDYNLIPTTVFSPTEYSFIGLSEEEAINAFGADNVEVYHRETTPLQYSIYKNNTKVAYMKVIVDTTSDKVVGLHYFGPSADEVVGGFSVAMKLGMTKRDLDWTIGIHPSTSEDLFNLDVTKRSGEEFRKTEC